jgi:hypothetical protein
MFCESEKSGGAFAPGGTPSRCRHYPLSRFADAPNDNGINRMNTGTFSCRPYPTARRAKEYCIASALGLLEHRRFEAVPLQEFVELGAVALGELGRLGNVAPGDLQEPDEVIAFE